MGVRCMVDPTSNSSLRVVLCCESFIYFQNFYFLSKNKLLLFFANCKRFQQWSITCNLYDYSREMSHSMQLVVCELSLVGGNILWKCVRNEWYVSQNRDYICCQNDSTIISVNISKLFDLLSGMYTSKTIAAVNWINSKCSTLFINAHKRICLMCKKISGDYHWKVQLI